MRIVEEFPPNYEAIVLVFPQIKTLPQDAKPVFAYGDYIYNPFKKRIPADIIFHESIHRRQQAGNSDAWWMQYLSDEDFRLRQEVEAYGEQFAFVRKHIPNNRVRKDMLFSMASALSGEIYGSLLDYNQAESIIRKYAKEIESQDL